MSVPSRLLLILFVTSPLVGCSEPPQRVPVAGVVLIDGEPLTSGSVSFVPEHGRPATSEIMTDGSFELAANSVSATDNLLGVVPGDYRVAVSAPQILSEDSGNVNWLAPSKYADFRTSGIEVKIDGPEEDLKIELTWVGNEALPSEDQASDESLPTDSESDSGPVPENGEASGAAAAVANTEKGDQEEKSQP